MEHKENNSKIVDAILNLFKTWSLNASIIVLLTYKVYLRRPRLTNDHLRAQRQQGTRLRLTWTDLL
jgi:hypothetical protein